MNSLLNPYFAAFALILFAAASPASAEQWKRQTVLGGELTREVTRDGSVYSGETTRAGPNGGTYSSNSTCLDGAVNRCKRSFSAIGPNGKSLSSQRYSARGPYRVRSAGSVTGPGGNTYFGVRHHWR
jgi:hypothetical protein